MSTFELKNIDCLEYIKTMPDNSVDLIFGDPPYNLSSEVYIDKLTGKPDLKKANDFMNKWAGLDGEFLEEFYKQAYRILKYGGHCLLFGIDRQLFMFEYYANLSGFTQKQSLYWYFISNFPKASDLSKNLDKYFGAEREVVGKGKYHSETAKSNWTSTKNDIITAPSTDLAKKYNGIKYSVAPLKQTNETIMVFQKPYKTGSCLHDVLALENGDDTITCGGVDIEGNRCGVSGGGQNGRKAINETFNLPETEKGLDTGRFPAQTYIDSGASEIIDLQSGVLKSQQSMRGLQTTGQHGGLAGDKPNYNLQSNSVRGHSDSGGASRILHHCDFEAGDYDLYNYCPKVSKSERNEGLEGFEEKRHKVSVIQTKGVSNEGIYEDGKQLSGLNSNNHPTVKPKALLSKILKLFKTPNQQVLFDPFMGSGTMGISAIETGFNFIGTELDSEYFEIAKSRVEKAYYSNNIEIIDNMIEFPLERESQLRFFKG